MEPVTRLSAIISGFRARGIILTRLSNNDIGVSPFSALSDADLAFLEKNCDAISELMLHENNSVEVAGESPGDTASRVWREDEKGAIRPLADQAAASERTAINEAEADRLAAGGDAGREREGAASPPFSDGVHRSRLGPAESGQRFAIGMQVKGIHSVAAAFPPMEGPAYEELVESIRVYGLRRQSS